MKCFNFHSSIQSTYVPPKTIFTGLQRHGSALDWVAVCIQKTHPEPEIVLVYILSIVECLSSLKREKDNLTMGELGSSVMAGVYRELMALAENSDKGLSVQRVSGNSVRVDRFEGLGARDTAMVLNYTPIMFFLVTTDKETNNTVKLVLMTYNEQIFESLEFNLENIGDLFNFIISKFCEVTFVHCSGVRKENIKATKLKNYLNDDDTLFEKFGDNLVFRSVKCQRLIENEASVDLCSSCKHWLIEMETNSNVLPFDEEFVPLENNTVKYQNGDEDYDIDTKPYRRSYKRRHDENGSKAKRKRLKKSVSNGDHIDDDGSREAYPDPGFDDSHYPEMSMSSVKTRGEHRTVRKRHECPEEGCTERFKIYQGKLMRRHLENVHGQVLDKPKESFLCEKCDKKFKTFEILQKHMKGVHESTHVPCYICAKLVKEGTPMEHHIKYVHIQPNQFE